MLESTVIAYGSLLSDGLPIINITVHYHPENIFFFQVKPLELIVGCRCPLVIAYGHDAW
jgi:hypothetical protein